jgi:hypothetical protein
MDYNLHEDDDFDGVWGGGVLGPDAYRDGTDTAGGGAGWVTGEIPDRAPADTATIEEICELAANLTGYLDRFQTAGDGRVLYCHSGSGDGYNLVDSDIDSCSAHLDHRYDVFPSTGCDS